MISLPPVVAYLRVSTDRQAQLNTDPPPVRCGMCGGRCRPAPLLSERWIECRSGCPWSSHSPRRVGLIWRLRVWIGR